MFLAEHFSNSSFDSDIISKSFQLLHTKGKIFNHQENHFSWGIFFVHIASLFDDKNISNRSIAAIGAAIELLILATDIVDEIVDDDKDLTKTMTLAEAIILANALLMDAFRFDPKAYARKHACCDYENFPAFKNCMQWTVARFKINDRRFDPYGRKIF